MTLRSATVGDITAGGSVYVSVEGLFVNKHLPRPRATS